MVYLLMSLVTAEEGATGQTVVILENTHVIRVVVQPLLYATNPPLVTPPKPQTTPRAPLEPRIERAVKTVNLVETIA